MYTGFGIILYAIVMLMRFSAAKILPNPKLKNKRKFFIGGFSKHYGFASQEFLVVRGNGWGFLWSGRHTCRLKGVGVCQNKIRNNMKGNLVVTPEFCWDWCLDADFHQKLMK